MIKVIGAGLAGSEAAWQLAQAGERVLLIEQKPHRFSPAHRDENFCELVCSTGAPHEVFGRSHHPVGPHSVIM